MGGQESIKEVGRWPGALRKGFLGLGYKVTHVEH